MSNYHWSAQRATIDISMHTVRTVALCLSLPTLLLACPLPNPAPPLLDPVNRDEVWKDSAKVQCSSLRPQTEPDLMGWDPASRASVARLQQQGVIAVRYAARGCNVELEVLSNCISKAASYTFTPYAETRVRMAKSEQELFAEFPLSAASLSGKLAGNRALRTEYQLVGISGIPVGKLIRRSDLIGQSCERATHVVSAVYIGGFTMEAGEARVLEAKGSAFGLSAGTQSQQAGEQVDSAGDAAACRESASSRTALQGCSVPLRLGLMALEGDAAPQPGAQLGAEPASPDTNAKRPDPETQPTPAVPRPRATADDLDGDGVPNQDDACPDEPGPKATHGCPAATSMQQPTAIAPGIELVAVTFATGQSDLTDSTGLDNACKAMLSGARRGRGVFTVHSDSAGSAERNLELTKARAAAIIGYIVRHYPTLATRVRAIGMGETKPVSSNATAEGRAANRRVELQMQPL
jgi:outer membrane protein OmpA-like peptidoglycan-associated protein